MARYTGGVWQDIQGIIVCTTYVRKLMFPEGFLYGCVVTHPRSTDQRVMEYLRARTERSEACTCVCIIVCNVYGVWLDIQGIIVYSTYQKLFRADDCLRFCVWLYGHTSAGHKKSIVDIFKNSQTYRVAIFRTAGLPNILILLLFPYETT